MAAQFDNSTEPNLKSLLPHTGEGVVIDIGTGDGRFVSVQAAANPAKFYIGVDANVKPLEKPSIRATRKPAKGGLPNALFIQAAVEDLPAELDGVADEIHIHFPWGSLLKAVATADSSFLVSLRKLASPGGLLEIVIGIDAEKDRTEIERLGVPDLTAVFIHSYLIPKYSAAGFINLEAETLDPDQWHKIETSWSKKLWGNPSRTAVALIFQAT